MTRLPSCTCECAASIAPRLRSPLSGGVERTPGFVFCGALGASSDHKGVPWRRCPTIARRRFATCERRVFLQEILNILMFLVFNMCGWPAPRCGCGVSILVRDGVGTIQRPCAKGTPKGILAILVLSEGVQLTVTSAYFFGGHPVSEAALEKLSAVDGPLLLGADVNPHHLAWDARILF